MPRFIESLSIAGPAGRLEALLEEPESGPPVEAALVCHPHPLHGGTMHNKVVYRIARGLRKTGCVVLRFNYRGVNLSEGEYANGIGETEDARHMLRHLTERYPGLPQLVAGFSFGSRIALRLGTEELSIGRVLAVGFPASWPADREFASGLHRSKFLIHSTHDQYGPREALAAFFDALPEPKHLEWIEAADHFFAGALDDFEVAVERVGESR